MDDADAVQKATSPSRHLQRKPSKPPVTECLAELGEFDFRATQRKVGLHLDPGNGQSLDLILATSLLRLITRVRDELLPTMAVSDYSDSKRTNPYRWVGMAATVKWAPRFGAETSSRSGLREEVRYLEHVIHFLENVHVRNDKAALSTIISRRLFESGRTFKGFTVTDKKQWDQYVQVRAVVLSTRSLPASLSGRGAGPDRGPAPEGATTVGVAAETGQPVLVPGDVQPERCQGRLGGIAPRM